MGLRINLSLVLEEILVFFIILTIIKSIRMEISFSWILVEYANYEYLTRTVPVNGRFSTRQKNVYNSVLYVMKKHKMLRTMFKEYNSEIGRIMETELIKAPELLDKHDVQKQDPKKPLYRKYFMQFSLFRIRLYVGNFDWPHERGMVFTCEPGIYILEEELGIRLENDILITIGT